MSTPVVLITGALTGIGRATAIAFAKEGARLVVSGRREPEGKALKAELRELGTEAEFIFADVPARTKYKRSRRRNGGALRSARRRRQQCRHRRRPGAGDRRIAMSTD
jgi:NAD(P)-dependent dehydrogenase (short-subunit alcohol dehydrogenase family)